MRNIINTNEILFFLNEISQSKQLDNYPNIKKWLFSNARKHILNNEPLDENINIQDKPEILEHIIQYNIKSPVHFLKLDHTLKDKINHVLDFLKSDYGRDKDVSKISFPQSIASAKKWLEIKLKQLSNEEDYINTKPFLDVKDLDGKNYTWVTIHSKKGLDRESKLMSHCIESFWQEHYQDHEVAYSESPFYSLRDENNKPVLTAYILREDCNNISHFQIYEVKERFNELLSINHIQSIKSLIDFFLFQHKDYQTTNCVKIEDLSVSKWFSSSDIIKNNDFHSIIDSLQKNIPFKSIITEENITKLKPYFTEQQIFKNLTFNSLFLDPSNYLDDIEYFSLKLELSNFSNKKVSFSAHEVFIKNSEHCEFTVLPNSQKEIDLNFKKNSDCNIFLNLNCQDTCVNTHIIDSNKVKFSSTQDNTPQFNLTSILSDNIHIDNKLSNYTFTKYDKNLSKECFSNVNNSFITTNENHNSIENTHHFFDNIISKKLYLFLDSPFIDLFSKHIFTDQNISDEFKIMNSLICVKHLENLNCKNPDEQIFHHYFNVKEFILNKEQYIHQFISKHDLESLNTKFNIEPIIPNLIFTTQNFHFTNGINHHLYNYFDKSLDKISPYIEEQESIFKHFLLTEEFPVWKYLYTFRDQNFESLNLDVVKIACIKNMMIKVLKEDSNHSKEYLTNEHTSLNKTVSNFIFSFFVQLKQNNSFPTHPIENEPYRDSNNSRFILQGNLNNYFLTLQSIMNSEYDLKFIPNKKNSNKLKL